MIPLMLATGNPGKVAELRALLARHLDMSRVMLRTPRDWPSSLPEVQEVGTTFAENALLKARALAAVTGMAALADDSGLCVDALGGWPGIHSARWAGEAATDGDRNALLLAKMTELPSEKRTAHFFCAVALAAPDGRATTAEGKCAGVILTEPRGDNGFGYDPLFFLPPLHRTMAQITADEKNRVSHRARAISELALGLHTFLRFLV